MKRVFKVTITNTLDDVKVGILKYFKASLKQGNCFFPFCQKHIFPAQSRAEEYSSIEGYSFVQRCCKLLNRIKSWTFLDLI